MKSTNMSVLNGLKSVGIIERDTNNDILWTWSYPSVNNEICDMIIRKCGLLDSEQSSISEPLQLFFQFNKTWYFINSNEVAESDNLPKVKQFYLVLATKDFNPEKYQTLGKILSRAYCKNGNPATMLQLYLSVMTRGNCSSEENGTFKLNEYDPKKAFVTGSLKYVVNTFGLESILVYNALVLKKRIAVYHHKVEHLLSFIRALPSLVWHRQNWSILFPLVHLAQQDLDDLNENGQSHYVAGFTDAAIEGHVELYDLFINLAATEISVAPHAKEHFAMSKTHKEIALFMVRAAEDDDVSDLQMIKDVSSKTKELINNLKSLGSANVKGEKVITLEDLKQKKFAPATENFLFNFAVAENMVSYN